MDRCRCDEYAEAVKNLKFYTVGTLRPDIIENHDRSSYAVWWRKNGVDYTDIKFSKPRALKITETYPTPSEEQRKIENMWCPYMTPVTQERSRYVVWWSRHGVDYSDCNFTVPRAMEISETYSTPPDERKKLETMWCPYMSPVKQKTSE